jgi:phospholipid/cholesterol/gamma-HCH transport system substrate-binding protein
MAQRKQVSWNELRVGLFVLVGLFLVAIGIFYVTGPGILGPKYRLVTYLPEVEGLATGAPVRLDGVEIGNVDAIRITPRAVNKPLDPKRNIEVVMRIDKNYQNEVRTDSVASLVTEGLLGNRYVTIRRGLTGTPLKENEEVKGQEEKAIKQVVERSADVLANLSALSDQIRLLVDGVQRGKGTLGKLLTDDIAYAHLNSILSRSDQMVANIQAGQGALGKVVASDEIYNKAYKAVDRVDTMLADVQSQNGSLGKFIYDPSLYDNAKQAIEKGNAFMTDVRAGKGSLGKFATDDALYTHFRDTSANFAKVSAKLTQNETTAGKFINDPQFYDNLTGLAGDMRLLMGEFRQNPKKFLRVKFSMF